MRALVTGAAGFVGSHLVKHLLAQGDTVVASVAPGQKCVDSVTLAELDITSYESCLEVISRYEPEIVYHLAGIAFVPEAENDFSKALEVNVGGTHNLVRSAHLLDKKIKFLLASSAEVYGRLHPHEIPVKESQPVRPANNYSLSKCMAELVVGRYANLGTIKQIIMRPFNHIGPGQNLNFVAPSFASQLAKIKLGKMPPVISVGNLTPQRDFSDVRDIVRAYRLAAQSGSGVFNLGLGKPISIQHILDLLIEISEVEVSVKPDPNLIRPAEVPVLYADISRANSELGWYPKYDLRESLKDIFLDAMAREDS